VNKASLGVVMLLAAAVSACVSQTTIEVKVPDQPVKSSALDRAQIHTQRAAEYYRLGNLPVALEAAQQAVAANGDYAPAYNMLGIIYKELREDAKAQDAYERALRIAPNDSETLTNYGWFICETAAPAKAMPYFEQALRNPVYASPQVAHYNAGVCARRMGDKPRAEGEFAAAVNVQPLFAPPLYELAEIRFAQGRMKEAEALLGRHNILVQAPGVEALYLGARIAHVQGDRVAESSYLQQLRRRFPDAPQTRLASEGK
jgi:type IV pilus assembly protein PilF